MPRSPDVVKVLMAEAPLAMRDMCAVERPFVYRPEGEFEHLNREYLDVPTAGL